MGHIGAPCWNNCCCMLRFFFGGHGRCHCTAGFGHLQYSHERMWQGADGKDAEDFHKRLERTDTTVETICLQVYLYVFNNIDYWIFVIESLSSLLFTICSCLYNSFVLCVKLVSRAHVRFLGCHRKRVACRETIWTWLISATEKFLMKNPVWGLQLGFRAALFWFPTCQHYGSRCSLHFQCHYSLQPCCSMGVGRWFCGRNEDKADMNFAVLDGL